MNKLAVICAAATVSLIASGCAVSTPDYNNMVRRVRQEREVNDHLKNEVQRQHLRLAELEKANVEWQEAYNEMKAANEALESATPIQSNNDELSGIISKLGENPFGDLSATTFNVVKTDHAVGVRLDDGNEVLFHSGSWRLTGNAEKNINDLADAVKKTLERNPEYVVRIDGHTDSDPIRRAKNQGIEDNVHLGFMRAHTVYKALSGRGIPAEKLTVMTAGPHMPVSDKKNLNRRVEIWVSTPEGFSYSNAESAPTSVSR